MCCLAGPVCCGREVVNKSALFNVGQTTPFWTHPAMTSSSGARMKAGRGPLTQPQQGICLITFLFTSVERSLFANGWMEEGQHRGQTALSHHGQGLSLSLSLSLFLSLSLSLSLSVSLCVSLYPPLSQVTPLYRFSPRLEQCVEDKVGMETDLYSRFALVLHEKKGRIRGLQDSLRRLQQSSQAREDEGEEMERSEGFNTHTHTRTYTHPLAHTHTH